MSDFRFESMSDWLSAKLSSPFEIKLISGDASFRRYFRVQQGNQNFIAVDSPTELVPIMPFIELTKSYSKQNLLVPEVLAYEDKLGFKLLTDLGDIQLGSVLTPSTIKDYYSRAITLLTNVSKVSGTDVHQLPVFDENFIKNELNIFSEWFIDRHLQLIISDSEIKQLNQTYDFLISSITEQPQCTKHRDFHSRNIMVRDKQLYLIDYQDSVTGPFTYDAVSLLRDCYVVCPKEHFETLQKQHYEQSIDIGLINKTISFKQYQRWFDLTGLQRHLKIAGIFCRLFYRDGKNGYLKDIPQTLNYILEVTTKYPELANFDHWMRYKIIPLFQRVTLGSNE